MADQTIQQQQSTAAEPAPATPRCDSLRLWLLLPLLFYALLGGAIGYFDRERFNSDGVCYLHRAMLLAKGDWFNSVSGYWSPGLSWSVVPLLWMHVDPLHAIHLALFLWGAAYVATSLLLIRQFLPDHPWWVASVGAALSLIAVRYSTPIITPDIPLAAMLMFYFYLLPRRPIRAAAVGGLAFFVKAYALPFFLIHFLTTAIIRRIGWRSVLLGYFVFALLAGPWIGLLSWKYGKFTFSTASTRNRFMQDVSPDDVYRLDPDVSHVPPDPFYNNMEVTDADPWPAWSPLDSRAHFEHQLYVAGEHVGRLVADILRLDGIGLSLIACVLVLFSGKRDLQWLLLSVAIYSGGFLLVVYETRYLAPILAPVMLILCLSMCRRWEPQALPWCTAVCFACAAGMSIYTELNVYYPKVPYRQIAQRITDVGLSGCFATNTPDREEASCVAFYLQQKSVALPRDQDAATLQQKLDERHVHILYRWFDPQYENATFWPEKQVRLLLADGDWVKKLSVRLDRKRRLDIYERVSPTSQQAEGAPDK